MKKTILVLLLVLSTVFANARKFYFSSSTGNDSRTATDAQFINTPWQSLNKITYYTQNRGGYLGPLFTAGDTLAFKRGDVFFGPFNEYASFTWAQSADTYYRAPSGTENAPIVFTNYGDVNLPLPNFLHPNSTYPTSGNETNTMRIEGVSWLVFDGIQFNDYRFPVGDKRNPAFVRGAMILGHWIESTPTVQGSNNPANRGRMVSNCVVKNCYFSNMSFGFTEVSAMNTIITNNVFTNFKSSPDTSGTYDVLGAAIEGLSGFNVEISRNYFRGAWAGSGRVSSSDGMGGTALDIFWSFKNSKVVYNTFVDCSGVFEVGNLDEIDSATGSQYDTFAFNKVINCGQLGYIHGSVDDDFRANNHNLYFWNNVVISNNKDRMNGQGFGDDTYGDTQSFSQFWFFRSKTKCPNNSLPISDPSWSNPINPVYCNYNGARSALQYASDQALWGMGFDTLVDTRNNIFYSTSGGYMIYDVTRTRYKHKNNIYYIKGGFAGNNTALGGTLGTGEIQTTSKLFVDTTNAFPENWDLHLAAGSQAIGAGTTISGVTKDFAGIPLSGTPDIGLYKYSAKPLLAVSSTGITCKTRTDGTITVTVSGGTSPYTYRINNGTWQSSSSFTALPSGTYTVAVKDTNGALGTATSSVKGSNVVVCP